MGGDGARQVVRRKRGTLTNVIVDGINGSCRQAHEILGVCEWPASFLPFDWPVTSLHIPHCVAVDSNPNSSHLRVKATLVSGEHGSEQAIGA